LLETDVSSNTTFANGEFPKVDAILINPFEDARAHHSYPAAVWISWFEIDSIDSVTHLHAARQLAGQQFKAAGAFEKEMLTWWFSVVHLIANPDLRKCIKLGLPLTPTIARRLKTC
jgi:hypothetical protein